jgi:two-component system, response regulator, stage 0 sporulation protein F
MLKSVLLADSDVDARDREYEILSSMGYKVECAPNMNEAVVRLENDRPHLVIVDEAFVPDGGLKALERIRKFDQQMHVIFLLKSTPGADIEKEAYRLGANDVVRKDFSSHFMFKRILEFLHETKEKAPSAKYASMGAIMIVDDSADMRVMLSTFLKSRGFTVTEASSGDQALLDIKSEKPKLVLLDGRMPGMDGLVVLKKIKDFDESIKVVLLTGIQDEDVVAQANKLGASDYLNKPCDLEKLEALILSIMVGDKFSK